MKRSRALLLGLVLALAGCGGASTTSAAGSAAAPVPTVPAALPTAPAPAASANATATITVIAPAGFHQAKAPKISARSPRYVNPTTGNLLHVKVGGAEVSGSPFTVNLSGGTQTINAPVTANASPQTLTIEEHDSSDALILAQGSTSFTIATPGGWASPTVTLSINAQRVAITTDNSAGSDAQALGNGVPNPTPFCTSNTTLYPFAADLSNGFVLPGVNAGNVTAVPAPTLISQTPDGGTSALGAPVANTYPIAFDGPGTGFTAVFGVANPLPALGVAYPNGAYPGQWIGSAYIYKNCTPSLTAAPGSFAVGGSSTVTVTGGAPPFAINAGAPCSASPAGSRGWTLTASSTGTCTVTVTDNAGATSVGIGVTVNAGALNLACSTSCSGLANGPTAYTLAISEPGYGSGTFTLSNATGHCFFNPATSVTAAGGAATVYVTGSPSGGTCSMQVSDANAQSATATMTFVAAGSPTVSTSSSLPGIPGGDKATAGGTSCPPTCFTTPYPILQWGGYTYYPWSYTNNGFAYDIAAYDSQNALVGHANLNGDRYIGNIVVNTGPQTATFNGQSGSGPSIPWTGGNSLSSIVP